MNRHGGLFTGALCIYKGTVVIGSTYATPCTRAMPPASHTAGPA